MRTAFVFGVLLIAAVAAAPASGAPPAEPEWRERLREAIGAAAARSPELVAMESRIAASRHRVPQAAALPDPEVEVGIKDIPPSSLSLSRDDFTMEMISARQRFPGFGKLSSGKRAAIAELEGAEAEHVRHLVEIAADVADSFFHLAELDSRVAILEETRRRLSDAVTAARERYRVGKGAQADVLRANLEKTALEDRLATLRSDRRSEAARFNALRNLSGETPVAPVAIPPGFEDLIAARPVPPSDAFVGEAERESPAIAAAAARVRRAEAWVELARLERRPDWMLAAYYGRRQSFEDLAGLSLSFNLPWTHPRRLSERLAEREAELAGARADLAAARNTLRREMEQAYAELERSREQASLYRDSILPQAEINYRAAREAYAVGSIDFLTYVRGATDLSLYQTESVERETGAARALAALQKASGLPLIEGTPVTGGIHVE